jgi:hypothetical protein
MSLLEVGKTGASKQSWRSPGARSLLKQLMDDAKDPHNGKALFSDFLAIVLPDAVRNAFENEIDERRLVAIIEYWFTNNHNSLSQMYEREKDVEAIEKEERQKAERAKAKETIRTAVKRRIKEEAELMLLDWLMPNGKAMGDCTGAEVKQFGRKVAPWLTKIAAKVKPNERVRDVLNEADVRKMWGK